MRPHPIRMHRTGTAGWSLPIKPKEPGSHLHHYSRTLRCVEINSTFYRPHRAATWARWATETPRDFRFSIKAPKAVTHEAKLRNTEPLLKAFFEQIVPICEKAGPILFQLPPSLAFDSSLADFYERSTEERLRSSLVMRRGLLRRWTLFSSDIRSQESLPTLLRAQSRQPNRAEA
jgi:uncharacterized protein YecE (DUF72 family)